VVETVNYRGDSVLTAYRPVDVEGVDWVVFTDLGTTESGRALEGYARDMLFAIALFVVGVTFIAVRWANRIMAPVRAIASRIRAVRAGSESVDAQLELPARSSDEYAALSDNIDDMLRRLGDRRAEMAARSEERVALLREFLPATVVQRTEQGAGDVLDHVESATVTVLVLQGLGELVARLGEQDLRDRLAGIVDELDALAAEFGLERVKITGDSYCAVCGVSRPYLDHAARSVGFALAAREIVAELESELGQGIGLSCGVDSGPVSVGLTNRGGLVYDVWGPAVKEASELARHALVGEIAVSTDARRQLPDDFVTAAASDGEHAVVIRRDVSSEVSP
jgi:class 3 adenylate cyclase